MRRVQLLEELCSQVEPGRRAELLQQLAGGQPRSGDEFEAGNFLAAKPPEFNPGEAKSFGVIMMARLARSSLPSSCLRLQQTGFAPFCTHVHCPRCPLNPAGRLIAAGSYGRVYEGAGVLCLGQPHSIVVAYTAL